MTGQALLVIDVQAGMFAFPEQSHDGEAVVDRIALLIERARESGVTVVFVQHDAGVGKPLGIDQPGHALHSKLQPRLGEKRIVKRDSSAFQNTGLDAWLREQLIDTLTIYGMQSEYCIDSAVRGAAERGYKITLVSDAHTTFNTAVLDAATITALENQTLKGGFARTVRAADISYSDVRRT